PHLIRLLAAYSHRGHYYMMFPYARLNLHEYWERNATPICNYEKTLWVFQQISGIASALSRVHIYTADDDYRDRRLQVLNDDQEKRFGRHGDLKPDNILWSHQDQIATVDGKMGVLQIADFGLGRFHGRYSRSNVNPLTLVTSPTYQSPEIELRKPVSRKYDIWSLGCVYLEFASWLLLGWPGVVELADKRAEQNPQTKINDDYFYKLVGDPGSHGCTARLRQGVSSWIASLRKHPQCSEAIFQLLNIIESRMLAIDCAQRVECEKLSKELKNLYDVACENEAFLMNPHGRKEDTREPSPELTRPRQVHSI
ncbi:kinase-like domain-containing protein, partial [Talaromyces proteolyticus]